MPRILWSEPRVRDFVVTGRDENGLPGAATGRERLPQRVAHVAHSGNRSLPVAAPGAGGRHQPGSDFE